jgi:diacylglycerol kinase (ATP)
MPEKDPTNRFLFVVNPSSGQGSGLQDQWKELAARWKSSHPDLLDWMELGKDPAQNIQSVRDRIDTSRPERVVAVGGDGTLQMMAEILAGSGIPLAFLPAGSANGMAVELDLPPEPEKRFALAMEGEARSMDMIRVNGHCSIHLSDIGLNAQLVKYFDQGDRRGMWGYVREAWNVWRRKEKFKLEIRTDGKILRREAWMLVVANARLYGTGVAINPEGSVYDGRFELVIMRRISFTEILKMLFRNRRFDRRKTEVIHVFDNAGIKTDRPAFFQVDGEYVGEVREINCHIERGVVRIVAGEKGES